jgi:hypothetical protein
MIIGDQVISTSEFFSELLNGLYVFVTDSCEFCMDYRKDLDRLSSPWLKIVEVNRDDEKNEIWKWLDRVGFPLTVGIRDSEVKFVKRGQRFGNDFTELVEFLKTFPEQPLSEDELLKRQKAASKEFKTALYVFPPEYSEEARKAALNAAKCYDELAIDIDAHPGLPDDPTTRVRVLSKFGRKIVIFDVFETNEYSDTANLLIQKFTEDMKYAKTTIEHRTFQEAVALAERTADDGSQEREEKEPVL